MNTPWRISETDHSRVCILGADGRVMTEIIPGQVKGVPVTQEERLHLAAVIASAVNLYIEKGFDRDG